MDVVLDMSAGQLTTWIATIAGYLLAFLLIPRIVLDRREASATLAWILVVASLPLLGAALYFIIGRTRVRRRTRRRRVVHDALARSLDSLQDRPRRCPTRDVIALPEPARDIARVAERVVDSPVVPGNTVEVYIDGDEAFDAMEEAIRGARHHVHMMSYIYRDDATGRRFRDLLAEKAAEGVEVRLLVDGFGGQAVGDAFAAPLRRAGARFAHFSPVLRFSPKWRPILRNHRKLLVVDHRIGFAGGLNIGDEYAGRNPKVGPWRDTHVRVEGPAVGRLQEVFVEDWLYATGEDVADAAHFVPPAAVGRELVQVVDSGPDKAQENIHAVFFTAINEANASVHLTTPYFVPGPELLLALKAAAWRGVDVKLLLPGRSDLRLVQLAGRSYYRDLLEAGVQIYEHSVGILHAKTLVVDGAWSTVGSANMDIRSFRLNYEVNVLVAGRAFAARMDEIFARDLTSARRVTLDDLRDKPHSALFAEALARILSPVL